MFVIPGIVVLFAFVFVRPHEIFEPLRSVTMFGVLSVAALGLVLDARAKVSRPRGSPLFGMAAAFTAWSVLTVAVKAPATLGEQLVLLGASLIMFVVVAEGVQSFRAFGVTAAVLLAITLLLAGVGVEQGLSPSTCYLRGEDDTQPASEGGMLDGRACATGKDCEEGGEPGAEYLCEHTGLLGTHSIGGRVRFRGLLQDPNELAWAISMGVPLAFAFVERRRSATRIAVLVAALALGSVCVIMTQSRSGQLALAAVLGVYFVRRFGWRGAAVAILVTIPLVLLGGRSGAEAESSSQERLECWAEALSLWRENPLLGVGAGQFTEHHYLTAHNSFMLTLAELGPVGLVLWSAGIYLAFKVVVRVQLDLRARADASVARIWAVALLASLVGLTLSAAFLSIAYHAVLWIYLALVAALYAAVRRHDPAFQVRFGWRDLVAVLGCDVVLVAGFAFYIRIKGG
jgi:hypothetical protein